MIDEKFYGEAKAEDVGQKQSSGGTGGLRILVVLETSKGKYHWVRDREEERRWNTEQAIRAQQRQDAIWALRSRLCTAAEVEVFRLDYQFGMNAEEVNGILMQQFLFRLAIEKQNNKE